MAKVFYVIIAMISALFGISRAERDWCKDHLWPVYVGKRTEEAKSNCMVYDVAHDYLIVGGTATDESIVGQSMKTGFAYALDLDGNWMWSHTFYSEAEHLGEINSCAMSSDGTSVTLLGMMSDLPAIFAVDPQSGKVVEHIYLEADFSADANVTNGAIYA